MTLSISLLNPTNNSRQTSLSSDLELEVSTNNIITDGYIKSVSVVLNGKVIFSNGLVQTPTFQIDGYESLLLDGYYLKDGYNFYPNNQDVPYPGYNIELVDAYSPYRHVTNTIRLTDSSKLPLKGPMDVLSNKGIFTSKIKKIQDNTIFIDDYLTTDIFEVSSTSISSFVDSKTIEVANPELFDPTSLGFNPTIILANSLNSKSLKRRVVSRVENFLILDEEITSTSDLVNAIFVPQVRMRNDNFTASFINNGPTAELTLTPLESLQPNKIYVIAVEGETDLGIKKISSFNFRTIDTVAPQVVNLKPLIDNSEISFDVVDLLSNQIDLSSISVWLDNEKAIDAGIVKDNFTGYLNFISDSVVSIFLRPHKRFTNEQNFELKLQVSDIYGNSNSIKRNILNKTSPISIELIELFPIEESILNPTSHPLSLKFKTLTPIDKRLINISYRVNEIRRDEIVKGEFVTVCSICQNQVEEIGEVRVSSREISIALSNIRGLLYGSDIEIEFFLQEIDENGEYIGEPFFQRLFHYVTTPTDSGPIIDNFIPLVDEPVSRSTNIGFRALSLLNQIPIDKNSITVSINEVLAVDSGILTNGYTGLIKEVQGSDGNSVTVNVTPPNFFQVGETVIVTISIANMAGGTTYKTYRFSVVDTRPPTITFSPQSGAYKTLQRVSIKTDQPSKIYYTIDGSIPEVGKLNTFVGSDIISNLPIFKNGITQVKAIAINQSGSTSELTSAIYDINTSIPEIEFISPEENYLVDDGFVVVAYRINLTRGYITKVESALNKGFKVNLQNTTPESTVTIAGLKANENIIEIFVTDNYGNIGFNTLKVRAPSSNLKSLTINYSPLKCPTFSNRVFSKTRQLLSQPDVETIAIIGSGKRREVLVNFALGNGKDGLPQDFNLANPKDGRHFHLSSFPLYQLDVFLTRRGYSKLIEKDHYKANFSTGEFVLDHPLEEGEHLEAEYISLSDINDPTLFTDLDNLIRKHGRPTLDNKLSLAASLAFSNGAKKVLAIQPHPESDSWSETLKRLEAEECYFLIPSIDTSNPRYPQIISNCYNHVLKTSEVPYRKERVLTIPYQENLPKSARLRTFELDNNQFAKILLDGEMQTINPTFIAGALVGKEASLNPAASLTRQTLQGFTLPINKRSSRLDLDSKIEKGITSLLPLAAGAQIFQSTTSSNSLSPILQEPSVQRIQDHISKTLRGLLESSFTGMPITNGLLKQMQEFINGYLKSSSSLISTGQVISVSQSSNDPRQIDLTISFTPLFPLNNLVVTFNLLTSF